MANKTFKLGFVLSVLIGGSVGFHNGYVTDKAQAQTSSPKNCLPEGQMLAFLKEVHGEVKHAEASMPSIGDVFWTVSPDGKWTMVVKRGVNRFCIGTHGTDFKLTDELPGEDT